MFKIIIGLFLMGFSFGVGPCLASCGPLFISYLAGTKKNLTTALSAYFLFSLARIFVYLILGILIFWLGKFILEFWLNRFSKYLFTLGGIFIVVLGILTAVGTSSQHWLGGSCQFLQKKLLAKDKKSIILLGLIIGILPCGPLLALLGYVGLVAKNWVEVITYCLFFGLGTILSPLLILSALAGLIPRILVGLKESYYKFFSVICGLVIIFLGLQLILRAR